MQAAQNFSPPETALGPNQSVLDSILQTRIEQMEALTLPSDTHRQQILKAISKRRTPSERLSSFLDYMIDNTTNLNLEIQRLNDKLFALQSQTVSAKLTASPKRPSSDDSASELLGCPESDVGPAIRALLSQNERLQRLHTQDRALLLKQNTIIEALRSPVH